MKKQMFVILVLAGSILLSRKEAKVEEWAIKTYMPGIVYAGDHAKAHVLDLHPLYKYMNDNSSQKVETEDVLTYEMILAEQANDEYSLSEDLKEETKETTTQQISGIDMSLDKLSDFNYLLSKFYTVDSTTTIGPEQLNAKEMLSKDMHINTKTQGPKILIFHTHSQEDFVDSVDGDSDTTIVGMGKLLAEKLNAKGIETIHHDGVYDLIDGKLDRSKAYQMAEAGVKEILNQNPSIEVVIDLHRDGVNKNTHLVTTVDGKKVAKIMFFNGLSRTKTNGDIAYLKNPYIQDNLAFSFQMQLASENLYPGLARRIYLKGYRYSLHMMPKSLLIEAGAQTNTVEEMKNSMDLLANILCEVLL